MAYWMYCSQCESPVEEFASYCSTCKCTVDKLEVIRMDYETLEFMTEATDPRRPPRSDSG